VLTIIARHSRKRHRGWGSQVLPELASASSDPINEGSFPFRNLDPVPAHADVPAEIDCLPLRQRIINQTFMMEL
jgi:hypothetical protein